MTPIVSKPTRDSGRPMRSWPTGTPFGPTPTLAISTRTLGSTPLCLLRLDTVREEALVRDDLALAATRRIGTGTIEPTAPTTLPSAEVTILAGVVGVVGRSVPPAVEETCLASRSSMPRRLDAHGERGRRYSEEPRRNGLPGRLRWWTVRRWQRRQSETLRRWNGTLRRSGSTWIGSDRATQSSRTVKRSKVLWHHEMSRGDNIVNRIVPIV